MRDSGIPLQEQLYILNRHLVEHILKFKAYRRKLSRRERVKKGRIAPCNLRIEIPPFFQGFLDLSMKLPEASALLTAEKG